MCLVKWRYNRELPPRFRSHPLTATSTMATAITVMVTSALPPPLQPLLSLLISQLDRHPLPPPPPPPAPEAESESESGSRRRSSAGPGARVCVWMLDHIAQKEPSAERSLMHRYVHSTMRHVRFPPNVFPNPATTTTATAITAVRTGTTWVLIWLRWPGGMMEEWHQKLHNNTSPDDVVICRALLDYIAAGLSVTAYWRTLSSAGITAQRLASFDRPITSEPRFSGQQAAGLQRDLTAYLQTLQAVHGGDDLASAINNVLGYQESDMKGKCIVVPAVPHVVTPTLERHLRALLALQRHLASPAAAAAAAAAADTTSRGSGTPPPSSAAAGVRNSPLAAVASGGSGGAAAGAAAVPAAPTQRPTDVASLYGLSGAVRLMEMVVEARHCIRPFLDGGDSACGGRLVDVAFLDLALDSALRTAVEANIGPVKKTIADATAIYIAAAAAGKGANGGGGGRANGAAGRVIGNGNGGGGGGSVLPLRGSFAAAAALTQASTPHPTSKALQANKQTILNRDNKLLSHRPISMKPLSKRIPPGHPQHPQHALEVVRLAAENAALSCCPNDDLVYSNKWLRLLVAQEDPRDARDRMLQALAIAERLKRFLADHGAALIGLIQPAAEALADRLKLQPAAVSGVGEEVVRGSSGAPLAQLLASLEPALRQATGGGPWQHEVMREPTVLLVEGITGAEEIPDGCVAVLVGGGASGPGCPDVLSHSAVRARNMGVLLAGCHCTELVSRIKSHGGSRVMVRLEGADVQISFSSTGAAGAALTAGDGAAK
ncbi:hypothetical protein VOLCADRAFT_104469 [Volvox carteri f. nagariensis]|uniref:Alpha-glucan water dikinase phosphohistidine-like domain-containing protein n=1 Tax=Volvox carteri f. nagariensis TaxID=3068 RepID=D8TTS6_VOLCA|nr:uncharacterized protein VOLCADRAFT_104469 [Volvox carteri f. nagariensis]EFJ48915.1 hypothetical protein VOLCADRAFT_104469 [Volvox carteri f. nagariensis]|eukprot:XP_002949812.1 hypothetical protein VOLCADRAFT_104469 [Volvox carteri f. nagariensis]